MHMTVCFKVLKLTLL